MSIIIAIIVFSLLVFIHELGHFLLAKKNGIRVVEFSIGFGPRLFSFEKGDTRYSLKLLFFGGSCQRTFLRRRMWKRIRNIPLKVNLSGHECQ